MTRSRGLRHQLTAEEKKAIAAAYSDGEGSRSLAARYNVSQGCVTRMMKEAGIPRHRFGSQTKVTRKIAEAMIEAYQKGTMISEISKAFHVTNATARDHLRKAGVLRLTKIGTSEAQKVRWQKFREARRNG